MLAMMILQLFVAHAATLDLHACMHASILAAAMPQFNTKITSRRAWPRGHPGTWKPSLTGDSILAWIVVKSQKYDHAQALAFRLSCLNYFIRMTQAEERTVRTYR